MARTPSAAAPFARRLARALRDLHVADIVVLAIVGSCALDASAKLLSAPNPVVQSVVVIACTAAASKRLVAWRHGGCRPLSIERPSQAIAVVAGVAPCFLLPLLRQPFQDWSLWVPIVFPLSLRVIGASLMMCGVFGPFWLALRGRGASVGVGESTLRDATRPGVDACAHAMGLFLLSSSPLIGVLTTSWLTMQWCVDREQSTPTPSFATGTMDAAHIREGRQHSDRRPPSLGRPSRLAPEILH